MTKYVHPDVHDKGLEHIKTTAERIVVVNGDPADYAAVAAIALAEVAVTDTDFTIAAGTVSGRKITSAAKSTTVDVEGNPTHVVWVDDTNSKLLFKTEETGPQTLYVGNTVNIPAVTFESRDPA